jgi:hypothetical protein
MTITIGARRNTWQGDGAPSFTRRAARRAGRATRYRSPLQRPVHQLDIERNATEAEEIIEARPQRPMKGQQHLNDHQHDQNVVGAQQIGTT